MTHPMTRRALLASAPAACLPMVAGAVTAQTSSATDPIVPLYQEWLAARVEWLRLATMPGNAKWEAPDALAAATQEDAAREAIASLSPTSLDGVAAIACLLWDTHGPGFLESTPEYLKECEEPSVRLIAALWRFATGLEGLPPVPK